MLSYLWSKFFAVPAPQPAAEPPLAESLYPAPPGAGIYLTPNVRRWIESGERGVSSETILRHLTGISVGRFGDSHPLDIDDLRRCMLLLHTAPELQPLFHLMSGVSPTWVALVTHWAELTHLMDDCWPTWREPAHIAYAPNIRTLHIRPLIDRLDEILSTPKE